MKVRLNLTDRQWDLMISTLENGDKECESIVNIVRESLTRTKDGRKYGNNKTRRVVTKEEEAIARSKAIERVRLIAEHFRSKLVINQTPGEKRTKAVLKSLNTEYEFQKIFLNDKSFKIVDFYLPDYNIVVEIDGKYHDEEGQKKLDKERTELLKTFNKIKYVARIPELETKNTAALRNKLIAITEHVKKLK